MATSAIPASLGGALGFNVYRLALLFRRHLVRTLREYDLTPEQWQVLAALAEATEPLSQSELSYVTLKDRHSMSRMLVRMEESGWVKRLPDPVDERVLRVRPTPRARRDTPRVRALLEQAFEPALTALPSAQRTQLMGSLHKLITVMEEIV